MSKTSTATALMVCDPTQGDENKLVNHICILVATHGDGTLFSHDSLQEEDLVEFCVGLGEIHPEVCSGSWETKAVLAF